MSSTSLNAFVSKVRANNRLRYGDLRRLQRDILPKGLSTREEVEALLNLDQSIKRADEDWPVYLATLVKDFVISGAIPPGCVDRATAEWLVSRLSGAPATTALAIARGIVLEADQVHDELRAFVLMIGKRRSKPVVSRTAVTPSGSSVGPGEAPNWLKASFSYPWSDVWITGSATNLNQSELGSPRA